jgi:hypothetical protein
LLDARWRGFDTESKPTFAKNEVSGGPHVVQFSTRDTAWLFQLHRTECNPVVAALIASTELRKVGFGLSTDLTLIRNRLNIEPQRCVRHRQRIPPARLPQVGGREDGGGAGVRPALHQVAQGDHFELGQQAADGSADPLCGQRRLCVDPRVRCAVRRAES